MWLYNILQLLVNMASTCTTPPPLPSLLAIYEWWVESNNIIIIPLAAIILINYSPFSTDSKPSMDKLAELGVLSKVSSEWRNLGLLFGQSTSDLDNFRSKAMLDNKECCERVFDKWINDDGSLHYPLSW